MATGTLIIVRARQYADMLRHYRIVVDDHEVGRIRWGGDLRVELPCGDHRLVARIHWALSRELPFGIREREIIEVEVGSKVRGWALLGAPYFATLGCRDYLYLRRSTLRRTSSFAHAVIRGYSAAQERTR